MRGNEYKCGTPCELVAISEGSAKRDHTNEYDPDRPSVQPFREMDRVPALEKLEKYSFYNVLWIEWIGGIAYIQAAGRVLKECLGPGKHNKCERNPWLGSTRTSCYVQYLPRVNTSASQTER
jgi:hypothetical protein